MDTTTLTETIFTTQTRALELLRTGSEATAKALESWTDYVASQTRAVLPESINLDALTGMTGSLPTPTKAVATSFDMLDDLIAQQRVLAARFLSQDDTATTGATTAAAPTTATAPTAATSRPAKAGASTK